MGKVIQFGFGPHLTLDLYGCNKRRLSDISFITNVLDELPDLIGMHKISIPSVSYFSGNPLGNKDGFDQGGISAFVLIAESHIAIHTFAAQNYVSIDIFSCKEFDVQRAEDYLVKGFGAKKVEKNLFDRGKEFPKKIEQAKPIVFEERTAITSVKESRKKRVSA
jgi:S-adenosylmethionine decarboxylase